MRNSVAFDAFTKFSKDFLQSKLNKCKDVISKGMHWNFTIKYNVIGAENMATKSLTSRLIQLKNFNPPSLSEMNPKEWNSFLGKQLVFAYL